MHPGLAQMRRGHHRPQRGLDRAARIGEEGGDAGQRLVLFRIKDMEDRANQQRMAGLFPVVALLEAAFGRSEEHTSELQSLMRISYAGFRLKKKNTKLFPMT